MLCLFAIWQNLCKFIVFFQNNFKFTDKMFFFFAGKISKFNPMLSLASVDCKLFKQSLIKYLTNMTNIQIPEYKRISYYCTLLFLSSSVSETRESTLKLNVCIRIKNKYPCILLEIIRLHIATKNTKLHPPLWIWVVGLFMLLVLICWEF